MTVDPDKLDGTGFALSLTVGRTPDTLKEWQLILKRLFDRLRYMGMIRGHWVVEWQARGAPHIHMAAYFPQITEGGQWIDLFEEMHAHWLTLTQHLGTQHRGQHIAAIRDAEFWGKYMAKHAGRGEDHYQREQGLLPEMWQSSGRMWGKFGNWPTSEDHFETDDRTYYRWRRWIWRWQRARVQNEMELGAMYRNKRQIEAARSLLRKLARGRRGAVRSRVLGIGTFCPKNVSRGLLDLAMDHPDGFVTFLPSK
jgi:hypothetical protein